MNGKANLHNHCLSSLSVTRVTTLWLKQPTYVGVHWRRKQCCSPPERWMQGAVPPYIFLSMGLRCEIKLPTVIHSGMAQKRIEFFALAPQRTATVVQGKLALHGSWHMPRLHDTWRRGLCLTITCAAAPRVWHFSAILYLYHLHYFMWIDT